MSAVIVSLAAARDRAANQRISLLQESMAAAQAQRDAAKTRADLARQRLRIADHYVAAIYAELNRELALADLDPPAGSTVMGCPRRPGDEPTPPRAA